MLAYRSVMKPGFLGTYHFPNRSIQGTVKSCCSTVILVADSWQGRHHGNPGVPHQPPAG